MDPPSLAPSSEGDDSFVNDHEHSESSTCSDELTASLVPIDSSVDGFAATTGSIGNFARKRKYSNSGRDDVDAESLLRPVEPVKKKRRGSKPDATCTYIKQLSAKIAKVKATLEKGVVLAHLSEKSLRKKRIESDRATQQKHTVFRESQVRWTKLNSLESEMHRLEGQRFVLEKKLQKNRQAQEMVRKKKSSLDLITSTEKDAAFAVMVEAQSELAEAVVYHNSVQKGLQEAKDCLEKTHV